MYIKYNMNRYQCLCRQTSSDIKYIGLPADFPAPASGNIVLYADDGFVMRADTVEDYLRQTFEDGVLTLTNIPEPEPTIDIPDEQLPETDYDEIAAAVNAMLGEGEV